MNLISVKLTACYFVSDHYNKLCSVLRDQVREGSVQPGAVGKVQKEGGLKVWMGGFNQAGKQQSKIKGLGVEERNALPGVELPGLWWRGREGRGWLGLQVG